MLNQLLEEQRRRDCSQISESSAFHSSCLLTDWIHLEMEHQNMMNSGAYGSGEDVASAMADVTLNDGPREGMKNGTAAHTRPEDSLGKGQ